MNAAEADALGEGIIALLAEGQPARACALLAPVLAGRTPFRLLDRIGRAAAAGPPAQVDAFLDSIAAGATEGGWPLIGSALGQRLDGDLEGALALCRRYIVAADVWHGADSLAERVPGPALVAHFERGRDLLAPWRGAPNRWLRRATGVAVHFWAKRSRGAPELAPRAGALLTFLEPLFEEGEIDAVKGVGWGLKTLGRHYPTQVSAWLAARLVDPGRRPRAILLRKARTYL